MGVSFDWCIRQYSKADLERTPIKVLMVMSRFCRDTVKNVLLQNWMNLNLLLIDTLSHNISAKNDFWKFHVLEPTGSYGNWRRQSFGGKTRRMSLL